MAEAVYVGRLIHIQTFERIYETCFACCRGWPARRGRRVWYSCSFSLQLFVALRAVLRFLLNRKACSGCGLLSPGRHGQGTQEEALKEGKEREEIEEKAAKS